jgi:siroheme synthase
VALVEAGWRRSTPAAIVWNASLPDQSSWSGTLADLEAAPEDSTGPGTIVIGNVVALGRALSPRLATTAQEVCHG